MLLESLVACAHGEQKKVVSSGVPCGRDAEQEAAMGKLRGHGRVHSSLLNPAREQFLSSKVPRTKWTRRGLLSKVIFFWFPLILAAKNSPIECRMTFQDFFK